jgi:hypothetical protein
MKSEVSEPRGASPLRICSAMTFSNLPSFHTFRAKPSSRHCRSSPIAVTLGQSLAATASPRAFLKVSRASHVLSAGCCWCAMPAWCQLRESSVNPCFYLQGSGTALPAVSPTHSKENRQGRGPGLPSAMPAVSDNPPLFQVSRDCLAEAAGSSPRIPLPRCHGLSGIIRRLRPKTFGLIILAKSGNQVEFDGVSGDPSCSHCHASHRRAKRLFSPSRPAPGKDLFTMPKDASTDDPHPERKI